MTRDRPVPDYQLDPITDTHYAAMLHRAADLLYDAGHPRAVPWPDRGDLGRMRSAQRLRIGEVLDRAAKSKPRKAG